MFPYPNHDVAVTDVQAIPTGKTMAWLGKRLRVNVTIQNQGDYTETFTVTLFVNATAIAGQIVTLTNGATQTITFQWIVPQNFTKGKYLLSATVSIVKDEIDIEDNSLPNGYIKVTIPGDTDGDGVIGGKDSGFLGLHWPPMPYHPNCDFDDDGAIGGKDAGVIGLYWGIIDP
jgi:hypothetical protein